jgi:hypothetical protein
LVTKSRDFGPWLAMVTENEPASIFGGFGGLGLP